MGKIIFLLFLSIFLFVSHSEGGKSSPISLWQSDQFVIQGVLPEDWRTLSSEELDAIISVIPGDITQQSGEIVTGFQFVPEKNSDISTHNPRIIIFAKTDEYVNQEMIQKTYAWFEKNKNLLAGMLSDKVDKASIQNIEYRQNLPAILFQNNLAVNDQHFTELSIILFLKNSILNIVCIAEENQFAGYETVFRSFIESIIIPPALRHETALERPAVTSRFTGIFALLSRKWQPFLGVLLIIGIYGWAFRTGKERV